MDKNIIKETMLPLEGAALLIPSSASIRR